MVTWKDYFEKINAELGLTKRKKQTLDNLRDAGRVSQFAYECLNKEIIEEIEQTEARRKALTEKMTNKLNELEEQRIALEMFLANTEMAYVAGEINDEIHAKESSALDLGLDATKQELNWIKEVIIQLVPKESQSSASLATISVTTDTAEASVATEPPVEKTTEAPLSVSVEVPVEVKTTNEAKAEQIQPPTETPATSTPEERKEA